MFNTPIFTFQDSTHCIPIIIFPVSCPHALMCYHHTSDILLWLMPYCSHKLNFLFPILWSAWVKWGLFTSTDTSSACWYLVIDQIYWFYLTDANILSYGYVTFIHFQLIYISTIAMFHCFRECYSEYTMIIF